MIDILHQIADDKRREIDQLKNVLPLETIKSFQGAPRRFRDAISGTDRVQIIAEIKQASPSKGVISSDFNIDAIASDYDAGGVAAISVLTESKYFKGDYDYIVRVKKVSSVPVLCKDFVIDPYQIYHARHIGADAVLLIVTLHTEESFKELLRVATEVGLDTLTEVHSKLELDIALRCGATIIGVNSRDLTNFEVNLETAMELGKLIPDGVIRVAESGIATFADISRLRNCGYNAFLIGETLMRAADRPQLLRELQGE